MGEVTLTVATAAQMRDLGRSLSTVLRAGDLVILSGGLGAGKTTLTQGIGDGLGVRGPITSPTFVIARVHPSVTRTATGQPGPPLVHADAYRLGSVLELDDLDLDTDTAAAVTGEDEEGDLGDAPRTVRISAVGERWEGIKLPLVSLADRL